MASGAKVHKECGEVFEEMKMHHKHAYIVFKLNDNLTEVVVDKIGEKSETYDDLRNYLMECASRRESRYAAYDYKFVFNEKQKDKIVFIAWNPENSIIKQKMVYTSSKDYVKKALKIVIEVQATDLDELSEACLYDKATRGMKD